MTETLQTPVRELTRGTMFARRFEIIEELGKGGMGKVYRVFDKKTEEEIALKLIKPEIAAEQEVIDRFRSELKMSRKISHRNVCRMYDLGDEGGTYYITMEYVPGEDLKSFIHRSKQLSTGTAIAIARQVCEGLEEAHSLGVVHRDLKPSNIMIDKDGNARIMDFGIARSLRAKGITGAGVIIGTPEYMSPEQAEGKEVDQRADIYSLGVILFEMVTGRVPFEGDSAFIVAMKHKSEAPQDPRKLNGQIPEGLSRIILKCMEKEKERRYQTAEELLSDLVKIGEARAETIRVPEWKNSIAVLPFVDLSPDKDQEYFCDGIAEEIINSLSKLENLKVVARTSAFSFKGKDIDIREIGRKLNVETLLEGSLRKAADRLRINAQLINVVDGFHLWSERYDRKMEDVFIIQDEISQAIVNNLKIKLLVGEKAVLKKRYAKNIEAYNLYLKGRYYWNKWSAEGYRKSIEYYQRVLQIEPYFALAYAGLADAYASETSYSDVGLSPMEQMPKAKEAALKALELDDTIAEAHTSLANIKCSHEYDWTAAEREFRRALELNPNSTNALHRYSHLLVALRRIKESLAVSLRALELDPVDAEMGVHLAWHYYNARQYDEAIEVSQKTLEIDPNFHETFWFLGLAYEGKGLFGDAIAALQDALALSGGSTSERAALGHVYGQAGKETEAEQIFEEMKELSQQRHVSGFDFALVCAGQGKEDQAIEFLEEAYRERGVWMPYIGVDPRFEPLQSNARFQDLLHRMNFQK
jgi:serine/threonine-protein kinase